MREKYLLNPNDVVIEPFFIKEMLEYPNLEKLKPLRIGPYDSTKDPIDYVQTFQSHLHYFGASDAIMC